MEFSINFSLFYSSLNEGEYEESSLVMLDWVHDQLLEYGQDGVVPGGAGLSAKQHKNVQ